MKPELPQVQPNLDSNQIKHGLEKIYGQEEAELSQGTEKRPVLAPEDLARAGSVGVEAGLKNFELDADDDSVVDADKTDDTNTRDDDGQNLTTHNDGAAQAVGRTAVVQTPEVAAEGDEIEKEWVSKAKRIVEQTKSDPFLQERAVSRLQADYMKKRFNKKVKLAEEDR